MISGDALKTQFPEFDLCVANIPYGISSPLLAKLIFSGHSFRSATLLLQKEFAHRLLANPGDSAFNRLAVNVKLVATVEFLMDVSKREFVPCPKVDSSLVRIQPRAQVPDVDLDEWRAFTLICFGKKNKTIGAIFKQKRLLELLRRSQTECTQSKNDNDNDNDDDYSADENEDGEDNKEEEEGEEKAEGKVLEMCLFKEKIVSVLKAGGYEEKRPSKLSVDDLLSLLSLFNEAGIRFHPS